MQVIEQIYQPTAKDLIGGIRQTRFFGLFTLTSSAATSVTSSATLTTPPDTARFITGVSVIATPGAAQNFNGFQLTVGLAGTFQIVLSQQPSVRVAAMTHYLHVACELLALPAEILTLIGQFDAGGVANQIGGYVWGYDIPRANIT